MLAPNLPALPLAIGMLFTSGGAGSIAGVVLSDPLQKQRLSGISPSKLPDLPEDLMALVATTGFERVETEEMPPVRFSAFPGAIVVRVSKS